MHIGVVTTSYPRALGDASGQFVRGLNRYLRRAGHTVEVLSAGDADGMAQDEAASVLRIASSLFYAGGAPDALAHGSAGGLGAWLEALRFSVRLGRLLAAREGPYEAIISHWLVPCGLLSALIAPGKPHIAIAHSSDVHLLRRLGLESIARHVAGQARLVYTSASLRIPGAAGIVAPMGIDVAQFQASADERAAARRRLSSMGPTGRAVLFLGRLVPVKGVRVLLEAIEQQPALHLWIAGDGPQRGELQSLASSMSLKDRVRFWGPVGEAARRDLLWSCDALAVPSLLLPDGRTEGAPQVIVEGLAAGCAVVASAVGGMAELIGEAGYLVPPGNAAALGAALALAVRGEAQLGERARAAAARFDWSVIGPRILAGTAISPRES